MSDNTSLPFVNAKEVWDFCLTLPNIRGKPASLLSSLLNRMRQEGRLWTVTTYKEQAKHCKFSVATVRRGMLTLKDNDCIQWEAHKDEDKGQTGNIYYPGITVTGALEQGGCSPLLTPAHLGAHTPAHTPAHLGAHIISRSFSSIDQGSILSLSEKPERDDYETLLDYWEAMQEFYEAQADPDPLLLKRARANARSHRYKQTPGYEYSQRRKRRGVR